MPTNAAMTRAAEAKILEAHTFPDSLAMLENSAAAKASTNPASARKNRVHTSAPLFSQNRHDGRLGTATADLMTAGTGIQGFLSQGSTPARGPQSSWLAE